MLNIHSLSLGPRALRCCGIVQVSVCSTKMRGDGGECVYMFSKDGGDGGGCGHIFSKDGGIGGKCGYMHSKDGGIGKNCGYLHRKDMGNKKVLGGFPSTLFLRYG